MKQQLKLWIIACLIGACAVTIYARMTDEEVVTYIKEATAQGKNKQQIGRELLAKGVTQEQIERLKDRYDDEQNDDSKKSSQNDRSKRIERRSSEKNKENTSLKNQSKSKKKTDYDDEEDEEKDSDYYDESYDKENNKTPKRKVFGNDVFKNDALSFEPNENLATPKNYILGPGDEIMIDIWGANEDHIRQTITPEGNIMISQIGPVYLSGMTINEANSYIKNKFASKYAGVSGEDPDSEINLTLGQIRTIQVDILGQVNIPGTYRLSPFSNVFHALYQAGGINEIGTLRNVYVLRNGKRIKSVDLYDYLFDGTQTGNIRLQEGDAIIVPDYVELVNIDGNVKRPMYYEMKEGETLADLIKYAGGFTGDAYTDQVRLARQTGKENELFNIINGDFNSYKLKDGDIVTVGSILDRYANRVELKGSVFRPGMYALSTDVRTVGDLIKKADGLTEDAFTNRALLYRERDDLSLEIIPVDIEGIIAGTRPDITLKRNDILDIPNINEIEDRGFLTISGMVTNPGDYPYAANMTIEDLILEAGGLRLGASTAKIDVSRRIVDPASLKPTNDLAKIYTLSLKDGFVVDGKSEFTLHPYDMVEVRTSPGYAPQQQIKITGEVAFEGNYTLEKRNERVSDVVNRAGGIISSAYVKGAHILRKMTESEIETRNETMRLAGLMQAGGDSIAVERLMLSDTYNVALDLQNALDHPQSNYDLIMKDGDVLIIPERVNTVKISGDVMFPNTVTYVEGKNKKYYVDKAGGYGQTANKGKAFVVYANGDVARMKGNVKIEPGCQIIVPSKHKTEGFNWSALLSIATATGSIATMAAAIATMFKR